MFSNMPPRYPLLLRYMLTCACTRHSVKDADIGYLLSSGVNLQKMQHMRYNSQLNLDVHNITHEGSTGPVRYRW